MYGNYDKNESYNKFIDRIICEQLENYKSTKHYGADLASDFLEEAFVNDCVFIYTQDNSDFIKDHWGEASDAFDYVNDELGNVINPFQEPAKLVYIMVQNAVYDRLRESEFIKDNWDNEFTLDDKTIKTIKEELNIFNEKECEMEL